MLRSIRYLFYLVVLLSIGIVAYAYLGDISVPQRDVELDIEVPAK